MKTEYDAIVLDLDGVLWNATPATVRAFNKALAFFGKVQRVTEAEVRQHTGKPSLECLEACFPNDITQDPHALAIIDQYEKQSIESSQAYFYSGVLEGIPRLASQYRLFLVSNCADWYLSLFFNLSKCRSFFVGWDCNGLSGQSKMEMLLKIREKNQLQYPVYVGDTASDAKAARGADFDFIHAAYGFGKIDFHTKKVKDFEDLVAKLLK